MSAPELCRDGESLRFAAIKRKICIKRNPVKWTTNVHLETSQSCNVLIAMCKKGLWPDIWNREQILLQTANEQSIHFLREHIFSQRAYSSAIAISLAVVQRRCSHKWLSKADGRQTVAKVHFGNRRKRYIAPIDIYYNQYIYKWMLSCSPSTITV